MSLYKDYIKETQNGTILETEDGFITYFIFGKECFLSDVYVVPEKRRTGTALEFQKKITEIVKPLGCTHFTGCCDLRNPAASYSAKSMLIDGFKLLRLEGSKIFFIKEIK